jgi:hypothetical protein
MSSDLPPIDLFGSDVGIDIDQQTLTAVGSDKVDVSLWDMGHIEVGQSSCRPEKHTIHVGCSTNNQRETGMDPSQKIDEAFPVRTSLIASEDMLSELQHLQIENSIFEAYVRQCGTRNEEQVDGDDTEQIAEGKDNLSDGKLSMDQKIFVVTSELAVAQHGQKQQHETFDKLLDALTTSLDETNARVNDLKSDACNLKRNVLKQRGIVTNGKNKTRKEPIGIRIGRNEAELSTKLTRAGVTTSSTAEENAQRGSLSAQNTDNMIEVDAAKLERYYEQRARERNRNLEKMKLQNQSLKNQRLKHDRQLKELEREAERPIRTAADAQSRYVEYLQMQAEHQQLVEQAENANKELLHEKADKPPRDTLRGCTATARGTSLTVELSREVMQKETKQRELRTLLKKEARAGAFVEKAMEHLDLNQKIKCENGIHDTLHGGNAVSSPSVEDQIHVKAQLFAAEKELKSWQRKVEVAELSYNSARRKLEMLEKDELSL